MTYTAHSCLLTALKKPFIQLILSLQRPGALMLCNTLLVVLWYIVYAPLLHRHMLAIRYALEVEWWLQCLAHVDSFPGTTAYGNTPFRSVLAADNSLAPLASALLWTACCYNGGPAMSSANPSFSCTAPR